MQIVTRVNEDRKLSIDACIVRVMKSRRRLAHKELINEVVQQLKSRFLPEPTQIKARIEELINREFLERSLEQPNVYNYLA